MQSFDSHESKNLDSNKCESKNTTNKILTPNNYQKCPATLYFKAKIYLYFNGFTLSVMQGDNAIASYEARSGTPLSDSTQISDKQIAIQYDINPNEAVKSRVNFLESLKGESSVYIIGSHLPFIEPILWK